MLPLIQEQSRRQPRFHWSPGPEQFFRLDAQALALAGAKLASANRLGWAVQWGCVRMLGVFPTEDVSVVPAAVVRFAAEQLDVGPDEFAAYGARRQNRYEYAQGNPRDVAHPHNDVSEPLTAAAGGCAPEIGSPTYLEPGDRAGPAPENRRAPRVKSAAPDLGFHPDFRSRT
ncbi:DUF4158 domain-containing protein [Streptomyces sp. NBC_01294]|uniref:DUF4158 domain-containing protein n=1 Tax=Streptomyces sp. NBC_01294 TaxID=2903815 RepID=UPI002DD7C42D|nr:DUF4158 domain-containing protein [Streptomyces sp. NBC_01294]WRZ61484.1 DUF4158 domain-containing protein [Streptomyces sp. NBC_01294]